MFTSRAVLAQCARSNEEAMSPLDVWGSMRRGELGRPSLDACGYPARGESLTSLRLTERILAVLAGFIEQDMPVSIVNS